MDEMLREMVKSIPVAVAMIIIVNLFLTNEAKREEARTQNAKERETERRAYELQINNMWATNFKNIVDQINEGNGKLVTALVEHERNSKERYEKMGITNDLLKAAKEQLKK